MNRIALAAVGILAAAATAVPLTATPAAADCTGPFCATVRHAAPDSGYDAPFKIRCNPPGDPAPFKKWLEEGESSSDGARICGNVTHVRLLPDRGLHCDRRAYPDSRRIKWKNTSDHTRWIPTDTIWSWNCTHQLLN